MGIFKNFFSVFSKSELDDEFYEELEFLMISSDISVSTTQTIINQLRKDAKKHGIKKAEECKNLLKQILIEILNNVHQPVQDYPQAIMIVGVNGVGKTTSIGKLAFNFKKQNRDVLLVAGDTFRAAASEQLSLWAKKVGVKIIKQNEGADPASVVFDGIKSAMSKNSDVVLIDTAGRLHNKTNLMEELKKIGKVVLKEWQGNYKKYIVIDATTGQNALSQVESFNEAVGLDGIILTKFDSTAKGGVVFTIANDYNLPIVFVGMGEKEGDLHEFDAKEIVDKIL